MYDELSFSSNMPALLVFPGFWGDGGTENEREIGRRYAREGMVVFIADYFPETYDLTNMEDIENAYSMYDSFLDDTVNAQRVALLALEQLTMLSYVDNNRIGVIGFCFGGAMALNLGRAGGQAQVAVSLHGE